MKKKVRSEKRFDALAQHAPGKGYGDWIGVEMECFMLYQNLGMLNQNWNEGQRRLAKMIHDEKIPNVTVKADGSISSKNAHRFFETEITILFSRKDDKPLKKLCSLLNRLETQVNKSCGLHVHLDMRDIENKKRPYGSVIPRQVRRRGEKIENALPLMMKMVSKSRRSNSYCRPQMSEARDAINLGSFHKHNTIEVRLHQGSVNYEKISNWIDLLYRTSRVQKDMDVETPRDLSKYLGRPPKRLLEYVEQRIKQAKVTKKKKKKVRKAQVMQAPPPAVVMVAPEQQLANTDGGQTERQAPGQENVG